MSFTHQYITEHTLLKDTKVSGISCWTWFFKACVLTLPLLIESLCVKLSDYHERYNDCIIPQKCPQLSLLTDHWSTWPTYDRPVSTRGIVKNNTYTDTLRTIQQWPHKVDTQSWLSSWGVQTAAAVKVTRKPSGHASTSCFPWSWLQGRQWHWSSYRCH